MKWPPNPTVFGNLAQWISAIGTLGTLGLAFYGLSKAVPYFENLNLREVNAQLQLGNRALDGEKKKTEEDLASTRSVLAERQEHLRRLQFAVSCMLMADTMSVFLNSVTRKASALEELTIKSSPVPPELETHAITIRSVRDQASEQDTGSLEPDDRAELFKEWAVIDGIYGDKLGLVILPATTEHGRMVHSDWAVVAANLKIARDYELDLAKKCVSLATRGVEKPNREKNK